MKIILLMVFVGLVSACAIEEAGTVIVRASNKAIDFAGMEDAQRRHNQRAAETLILFMSLKTMFPDKNVRALAKAAGKGRIRTIEKLVAQGVDVNSRGTKGATPLYWAIRKNNVKGFRKLLELGADPNVTYEHGSPMGYATEHRNLAFLQVILEHGGNPNLIESIGTGTSFKYEGDSSVVETRWLEQTPLHRINLMGVRKKEMQRDVEQLKLLLKYGVDTNAKSTYGFTFLMNACFWARSDIAYMLLNNGADYNLKNKHGDTVMDIVRARLNLTIPDSETAMELEKIAALLTERGAKIPEKVNKHAPYHIAPR